MPINKTNYVDSAEKVILSLKDRGQITSSQIRNILSITQRIFVNANRRKGDLGEDEKTELQILRTRLVYDSGRDNKVKNFVKRSELLDNIKEIGNSREKLLLFCRYLEALVAYHKFYGGK